MKKAPTKKAVVTAERVQAEFDAGRRHVVAPRAKSIVTPEARSLAHRLGMNFMDEASAAPLPPAPAEARPACRRDVDASGLVVVRGRSVRPGRFPGAGPGKDVRLADVITGADGSPMTAGIMSWKREDSFPWTLDYDEIDYVLEGVLHVTIDGRVNEARAGDVVYIPKGSKVLFGTPNRTRVLYVTYPANWSEGAAK